MPTASQIRDRIAAFLRGRATLEEFEDWLVQNTWNIHLTSSPEAEHLAYAVELRLSEYSVGHLTGQQLRDELRQLSGLPSLVAIEDPGARSSTSIP